jgi:hypothetical protein
MDNKIEYEKRNERTSVYIISWERTITSKVSFFLIFSWSLILLSHSLVEKRVALRLRKLTKYAVSCASITLPTFSSHCKQNIRKCKREIQIEENKRKNKRKNKWEWEWEWEWELECESENERYTLEWRIVRSSNIFPK